MKGAKMAIENAAALQNIARNAADQQSLGIASSLAILSAEESIKAFFCLRKHYSAWDAIDDFDDIFKDHKIKHKHIVGMLKSMREVMESSKYFLEEMRHNLDSFLEHRKITITIEERADLQMLINQLNIIAQKPLLSSETEMTEWWKKANLAKNQGLYVGLHSNCWHNPSSTETEFFNQVIEYAEMTILYTTAFMGLHSIHRVFGFIKE